MDNEELKRLVEDAYEEGVEDGIGWHAYPESGPRPGWIDSVARVNLLKARTTPTDGLREALIEAVARAMRVWPRLCVWGRTVNGQSADGSRAIFL